MNILGMTGNRFGFQDILCLDAQAAYRRRLHAAVAAPFWQSKYTSFPLLVN